MNYSIIYHKYWLLGITPAPYRLPPLLPTDSHPCFLVSKIPGFKASWFQRFNKCPFHFLEEIDPISKISRIYRTDRQFASVPVFSKVYKFAYFQSFEIYKRIIV